jgi:AraC-like DNA-binding protein
LFSLFLGAAPVITLGVLSYFKAAQSMEQKVQESNQLLLRQTKTGIEDVLTTVDYAVNQFITTSFLQNGSDDLGGAVADVNDLVQGPLTWRQFETYRVLSNMMHNLQLSKYGIMNASLVSFRGDWVISNAGLQPLTEALNREVFVRYAGLPAFSVWVTSEADSTADDEEGSSVTPASSITLVKKLPLLSNSVTPDGLLAVDLDIHEVTKFLPSASRLSGMVILDKDFRVLFQNVDEPTDLRALSGEVKRHAGAAQGAFEMRAARDVAVLYAKSDYNGWYYVSVLGLTEMTRDSRTIGWITFLTCLAIFLVTAGIIWVGARRMYNPIGRLYKFVSKMGPESPVPGNASRDEFSYIEERFQTLLSTDEQLRNQIRDHHRQLSEWFVLKLLFGQIGSAEALERLKMLGLPSDGEQYAVFALQIDAMEEGKFRESEEDLLLFAISNIVGELIPASDRLDPVLIGQSQVTVLIGREEEGVSGEGEESFSRRLDDAARSIQESAHRLFRAEVSIGISRSFERLELADTAYVEALEALKLRFRLGTGIIVHLDEADRDRKLGSIYPARLEKELLDALRMGQADWAAELLREFMREAGMSSPEFARFQWMVGKLLIRVLELVEDDEDRAGKVLSSRPIFDELNRMQTFEQTGRWFLESVVFPVLNGLENRRETQEGRQVAAVVAMIREQFELNPTLEACAVELQVHPSYLSKLFKQETGVNFSEYVAKYRLNMTKQWLQEGAMTIADIAKKLHYNSSAAFIRYFRNMEGMTPGQYREKFGKRKGEDE